jgi:hypothetical protein
MPKNQHICFVGSKNKEPVSLKALKKELYRNVDGIKNIIFPNSNKWIGYSFIMFYSEEQLKVFTNLNTIKL